ncbi:murein DD-endopeptidase MepM/ murein hydrolase activator NlpD [Nocardioides thalensis]|uniref:Murein DD-endopeptidase MepM/ murein hydrolase activator NlpD n=1 Tax=Nocardioides thalensis TaxID=1914755 RepID=A0A853C0L3_9ACTN|nr:M23 family metallopeptidase [Nocardioides thalensis]NYJ00794.1 murein DD-endopeptidase MepM/ murein hydrolase activator NlpD [Nocardioides thalensis]
MRTVISSLLLASALAVVALPRAAADDEVPRGAWPLRPQPEVVERFDPPDTPYGAGHRGVDLLGRPGQTVHAALAGTVTYAGMLAGRGVVVVDHGDTRTTYEPVSASVQVGDPVAAGAPIGSLDLPGSHCFPRACLHWGWIRNSDDVYLDPLLLVGLGPVRLLPLWRDEPVAAGRVGPGAPTRSPYAGWTRPVGLAGLFS